MSLALQLIIVASVLILLYLTHIVPLHQSMRRNIDTLWVIDALAEPMVAPARTVPRSTQPYWRALLLIRTDPGEAEHYLRFALGTSDKPAARIALLQMWEEQGNWSRIIEFLHASERISEPFLIELAARRLLQGGEREAGEWLNIMHKHQPEQVLAVAEKLIMAQHFPEAEHWAKSVTSTKEHDDAQQLIGRSLFYQRQFHEAAAIFEPLYRYQPDRAEIAYWYGRALLYADQPVQAIAPLERATQHASRASVPLYLVELSSAYGASGRCRDAWATIERSLQYSSNSNSQLGKRLDILRESLRGSCG